MAFHHQIANSQFNEPQKAFSIEILERLRGKKLPLVSPDAQNVTMVTREYPDGAILAEICSINSEPLKKTDCSVPHDRGRWNS